MAEGPPKAAADTAALPEPAISLGATAGGQLGDLLHAYDRLLHLLRAPPEAAVVPRWVPFRRALGRLLDWRRRWALSRFVTAHVRATVDALLRAHARRKALGIDGSGDPDREALEQFAVSLPRPALALLAAVPLILIVLVAQALLQLLKENARLAEVLGSPQ